MEDTMRLITTTLVFATLTNMLLFNAAQNRKSYPLKADSVISLYTFSGDIAVNGYDGDTVNVTILKKGRDQNLATIEDQSDATGISIKAHGPANGRADASVSFLVEVPRNIKYRFKELKCTSGSLKLNSLTGDVEAQTTSGDVRIQDLKGSANASTASGGIRIIGMQGTASANTAGGSVNVEIISLNQTRDMGFSSTSGNVNVVMPINVDAEVNMSTASGSLKTNFPIQVNKPKYGTGANAKGRVGKGTYKIRISAASGNVNLRTYP
jgi:DUF4097 and DUF4098 domain-containing protein YvlB